MAFTSLRVRHRLVARIAICISCIAAIGASAQDASDLLPLITAARTQYTAATPARLGEAKSQTKAALDEVQRLLDSGGSYDAREWRKRLQLDVLEAELAKDKVSSTKALASVLTGLYQADEGLEQEAFVALRTALKHFVGSLKLSDGTYDLPHYLAQLDKLQKVAQAPITRATFRQLTTIYAWLLDAEQAADLTQALRERFGGGNLQLRLGQLPNVVLFRENRVTPVNEWLFDSEVTGQTQAQIGASLRYSPDTQTGDVRIQLSGLADTYSTAHRTLVSVTSAARTTLAADKRIGLDRYGFVVYPSQAYCATASTIVSVDGGPIASWIAERRASELQPQADALMSQRADAELINELDQKVNSMVAKWNETLRKQIRATLTRLGYAPPVSRMRTSESELRIDLRVAPADALTAFERPPAFGGGADAEFLLNETAIDNGFNVLLGGVTVAGRDLAKLVKLATGSVPEELESALPSQTWDIQFAKTDGLTAEFLDGNRLVLQAKLTQVSHAENTLRQSTQIRAEYTLESGDGGVSFRRAGEVQVSGDLPPDWKSFVQTKANLLLRSQLTLQLAELAKKLPVSGLQLHLAKVQTANEWLGIGLTIANTIGNRPD